MCQSNSSKDYEPLLREIFAFLSDNVLSDPYSSDGKFAKEIQKLPPGLRAMAATHWLDISLTLDDIGWHFLNFGEKNQVIETEQGLRILGLNELADIFHETYSLIKEHIPSITSGDKYHECLKKAGCLKRIDELG
jgi:hypothetical protein